MTRKIPRAVAAIKAGKQQTLHLGNLNARRDWGYVAAIWKTLQCDHADDFVIGTGEAHSVRDFLDEAFAYVNLDWRDYVQIAPRYFRPTEADFLQSSPGRAIKTLHWQPSVCFGDLVRIMVAADLEILGLTSPGEDRRILENFHGPGTAGRAR